MVRDFGSVKNLTENDGQHDLGTQAKGKEVGQKNQTSNGGSAEPTRKLGMRKEQALYGKRPHSLARPKKKKCQRKMGMKTGNRDRIPEEGKRN